jgi:hypothetical protein
MPDVAADSQEADGNRYCNGHGRGSDGAPAPASRASAEKTAPASHVVGRGRMAWIAARRAAAHPCRRQSLARSQTFWTSGRIFVISPRNLPNIALCIAPTAPSPL